jgi:hypothetical protein
VNGTFFVITPLCKNHFRPLVEDDPLMVRNPATDCSG